MAQNKPIYVGYFESKINKEDMKYLQKTMTVCLGIDYFKQGTNDYEKIRLVCNLAYKENYSSKEFRNRINEFIKLCKFPTWTPADFFNFNREKLYKYNEVAEITNGTFEGFETVKIDGFENPLWKKIDLINDYKVF